MRPIELMKQFLKDRNIPFSEKRGSIVLTNVGYDMQEAQLNEWWHQLDHFGKGNLNGGDMFWIIKSKKGNPTSNEKQK